MFLCWSMWTSEAAAGGEASVAALSWGEGRVYSQADFFVDARNSISFPRSSAWPSHSHPHWQRMESHNRAFLRSALHTAHDLIHMIFPHSEPDRGSTTTSRALVLRSLSRFAPPHPPLSCQLAQDRYTIRTSSDARLRPVREKDTLF
jgi:hypothetical protein